MSRDQLLTLVILGCLIALFLWDRLRYDVVALLALLASVEAGIVPADKAFSGFSNPILPLIGAALIVSVAIGQSGAIEILLRWLQPMMRSKELQVGVLVACVALLSAFMKNIGALAIRSPASRAKVSEAARTQWADPAAREKMIAGLRAIHADPVARQKQGSASKQRWADPAMRAKIIAGMRAAAERRRNRDTTES